MITQETIKILRERLASLTTYRDMELIERREWGAINFNQVKSDIESVLYLATVLSDLPIEHLPNTVATGISDQIPAVIDQLTRINEFSIEVGGDPKNQRDDICNNLVHAAEELQNRANVFIPYLAYRRGDIDENIQNLNESVTQIKELYNRTQEWVAGKKNDVDTLVEATRQAAASEGVATFTKEFENEASDIKTGSTKCL